MTGRVVTIIGVGALLVGGCATLMPASDPPSSDRGQDAIISDPMGHPTDPPDGTGEHLMGDLNGFVHEN